MFDEQALDYNLGDLIAGQYEIVKELSVGRTGLLYLCHHFEFYDRLVAVKILYPFIAQNNRAKARLQQEVSTSYLVTHPNIIRTYEYIKEGDLVGYSMEYVDGTNLDSLLKAKKKFTIKEIVHFLQQICSAINAIHEAKLVFRNLKPENIIITPDNVVKISDFSFAYLQGAPRLTEKGGFVGSISYISPEYLLNSEFDNRSDIYSIGIIAYELLTGKTPLSASSTIDFIQKRSNEDISSIEQCNPSCPQELKKIVLKALKRSPDERYQSAMEMLTALKNIKANIIEKETSSKIEQKKQNSPAPIIPFQAKSTLDEKKNSSKRNVTPLNISQKNNSVTSKIKHAPQTLTSTKLNSSIETHFNFNFLKHASVAIILLFLFITISLFF